MNASSGQRIVIHHVSGSKANQIEHIPVNGRTEFRIGSDPSSDIAYDSERDRVVSFNHAVIGVSLNERPPFTILDLSGNIGTFLDNVQIREKQELLPDDTVMLGENGPAFKFDVQPRLGLRARTRVITLASSTDEAVTLISRTDTATRSSAVKLPPDPDPDHELMDTNSASSKRYDTDPDRIRFLLVIILLCSYLFTNFALVILVIIGRLEFSTARTSQQYFLHRYLG